MWDRQKLDEAINRNILFFDSKAKAKEITPKILAIMQSYAISNGLGFPKTIFKLGNSILGDWINGYSYPFGCTIISCDRSFIEYFLQQGCCLAANKKHLFIVETHGGHYLLGSC